MLFNHRKLVQTDLGPVSLILCILNTKSIESNILLFISPWGWVGLFAREKIKESKSSVMLSLMGVYVLRDDTTLEWELRVVIKKKVCKKKKYLTSQREEPICTITSTACNFNLLA